MLDFTLQDLQSINRNEEIALKANINDIRRLLTESQKAIHSLVSSVTSMHEDLSSMSRVVVSVHNVVTSTYIVNVCVCVCVCL